MIVFVFVLLNGRIGHENSTIWEVVCKAELMSWLFLIRLTIIHHKKSVLVDAGMKKEATAGLTTAPKFNSMLAISQYVNVSLCQYVPTAAKFQ